MDVKICKACGRSIAFVQTAKGRKMPVDFDTWHAGDYVYDPAKHVSHWATCSDPKRFSRPHAAVVAAAKSAGAQVADAMKAAVDQFPTVPVRQVLKSGLVISLRRDANAYHLALGRRGVYPADNEVAQLWLNFGVPADARRGHEVVGEYRIIRASWPALAQMLLPFEEVPA